MTQKHRAIAAAGAYGMAALGFSGILYDGTTGRLLVGAIWSVAAIGWTMQYRRERSAQRGKS